MSRIRNCGVPRKDRQPFRRPFLPGGAGKDKFPEGTLKMSRKAFALPVPDDRLNAPADGAVVFFLFLRKFTAVHLQQSVYACKILYMKTMLVLLWPLLALSLLLSGCVSQKEDLSAIPTAADYIRLQPDKYLIYRLDSTVFTKNGRAQEVHAYQEKHVVDAEVKDNLGRPSYRVFRFLSDTAGVSGWSAAGAYMITLLPNSVEVIEDNLRVLKLYTPISPGASWKGNRYLPSDPYAGRYSFSNDDDMADWEFKITGVGETTTCGTMNLSDVITLRQQDETTNDPATMPGSYATRSYSLEQYAKNLGLVFQELTLWEYQPNDGGTPYKTGFSVKRSLIDHN